MTNSDLIKKGLSIDEYLATFKIIKNSPVHARRQKILASIIDSKNKHFEFKQGLSSWNFDYALPLNIADHHTPINKQMLWLSHLLQTIIFWKNNISLPVTIISDSLVSSSNNAYGKRFYYKDFQLANVYNKNNHNSPIALIQDLKVFDKLTLPSEYFDTQTSIKWIQFWSKQNVNGLAKIEHQKNHADQITIFNNHIWKQMWSTDLAEKTPELIFTPLEEICISLLIENCKNIPYFQLLFKDDSLLEILNEFENFAMCWSPEKQTGTHFFWFIHPFAQKLISMKVMDGFLVPDKEGLEEYKILWNQESVIEAVIQKKIMPSVFTCMSVLVFWTGINPIAGFASFKYLDQMKEKWLKILAKYNYWLELELLQNIPKPFLSAGFNLIMEENRPISALDLAFTNGINQTLIKELLETKTDIILELNSEIFEDYWKNKTN